ncbi:c-type cytochrome, partial [bacterium]|nr:c-type cytochrome [bacterium]
SGKDTWRCKECHGWDYMGADGAYGSGSHFTGFPGVAGTSSSIEEIVAMLSGQGDPDHDFSEMDLQARADLAAFVFGGLEDYGQFIDADKAIVGGDAANGQTLYAATCVACHGADGTQLNFGSEDDPEFLGTIAQGNPWEFFHKVRSGQPGTPMPSAINSGWSLQDVTDVVAYAQSLPTVSSDVQAAVIQGGLLYDKWWAVLGLEEPTGDNPMWARQATNERSGKDTWRCKECHGWDYMGADGAYGSGSHFTGFPGVFGTSLSEEDLVAQISGEVDPDHDFSIIGHEAAHALAAMISGGLEDYGQFIGEDKAIIGGDAANGELMYAASCAACHGADGTQINFGAEDDPEFVGTIAQGNPWEFFHKVRFGQPDSQMGAAIAAGWSLQEVADLAAYSQTLLP